MGVVDFGLDIQGPSTRHASITNGCPTNCASRTESLQTQFACCENKGHKIQTEHFWGDAECIAIDPKTNERLGAPDGRNNGKAVGYWLIGAPRSRVLLR